MKEKPVNYTDWRGLICIALLLFILAGSGIACASSGEGVQIYPTDSGASPSALVEPPDTTAYQGSSDAFSLFYNPAPLWCALGAVIVLLVGYVLVRKSRGKDAP